MNRLSPQTITVVVLVLIVIFMVVVFARDMKPRYATESEPVAFTSARVYYFCKKELIDLWPILSTLIAFGLGRKSNGGRKR